MKLKILRIKNKINSKSYRRKFKSNISLYISFLIELPYSCREQKMFQIEEGLK